MQLQCYANDTLKVKLYKNITCSVSLLPSSTKPHCVCLCTIFENSLVFMLSPVFQVDYGIMSGISFDSTVQCTTVTTILPDYLCFQVGGEQIESNLT